MGSSGSRGRRAPPAKVENRRNGKDLGNGTFEADGDNAVEANALLTQQAGSTVGLGVELTIGEMLILIFEGDGGRGLDSLGLNEWVQLAPGCVS